jgi:hypothetical protein
MGETWEPDARLLAFGVMGKEHPGCHIAVSNRMRLKPERQKIDYAGLIQPSRRYPVTRNLRNRNRTWPIDSVEVG